MPADHLNLPADQLAAHAQTVLAGEPLPTAAAKAGIDPAELADAVRTYHAGGLAALQHGQQRTWAQVRLTLPDWDTAEASFAAAVAPRIDRLDNGQAAWWFLRKHPCWRLRIRTSDRAALETALNELAVAGVIDRWRPGIYEPETAAFGGSTAMDLVHDLFCADSRGVVTYARQHAPQLGRRELSLLLITALQQHAGLDRYEAADVFHRVAQMRPLPADADPARLDTLAARISPLWAMPVHADTPPFTAGGPLAFAAGWLTGFVDTGRRLGQADTTGTSTAACAPSSPTS
jgi:thiopeptide-type bacteriocin biosynthesis protein